MDFNRRNKPAANKLMKALTDLAPTLYFLSLSSTPDLPRLDFVRGGFIDPRKFKDPHDKEQWDKPKSLPNLIYTDGNAFSL